MSRFETNDPPERRRLEELGVVLQTGEEVIAQDTYPLRKESKVYEDKSPGALERHLAVERAVISVDDVDLIAREVAIIDGTPRFMRESFYTHGQKGKVNEKARTIQFTDGTVQVIAVERDEGGKALQIVSKAKGPGEATFRTNQKVVSRYDDDTGQRVRYEKTFYDLAGIKVRGERWERLSGGTVQHVLSYHVGAGKYEERESDATEHEAVLVLDAPNQIGHAQPIPTLAREHLKPFTFE